MLIPDCDFCHLPQKTLGAVLFGPPNDNFQIQKLYCCIDCWQRLTIADLPASSLQKVSPKSHKEVSSFLNDLAAKYKELDRNEKAKKPRNGHPKVLKIKKNGNHQ
jgi:hypothetical protein